MADAVHTLGLAAFFWITIGAPLLTAALLFALDCRDARR